MTIKPTHLSHLENDMHHFLISELTDNLKVALPPLAFKPAEQKLAQLQRLLQQEDELIGVARAHRDTQRIQQLERERDKQWRAFSTLSRTFAQTHPTEAIRSEAARLNEVLHRKFEVDTKGRAAHQTNEILVKIDWIRSEGIDLQLLGLDAMLDNIEHTNATYHELVMSRHSDLLDRRQHTMRKARARTDRCLRELYSIINALLIIHPDHEPLARAVRQWNYSTTHYFSEKRRGRAISEGMRRAREEREKASLVP